MNSGWQFIQTVGHAVPAQRIGLVLLRSIWQDSLVAVALAFTLLILRNRSAAARYVAACAALAAMVLLPIVTALNASLPLSLFPGPRSESIAATTSDSPLPTRSPDFIGTFARGRTSSSFLPGLLTTASYAWLAGVFVLSLWNLTGWARIKRLPTISIAAPAEWELRLSKLAVRLRVHQTVILRICNHVATPAIVGFLRPTILVPACAIAELSPAYLESLLLHELAHIKRHDFLINLVQTAIETLLFYHPAAWWASSCIRRERENCCDDLAARNSTSVTDYAKALAAMEELRGSSLPIFALGALGNGQLLHRIERLLIGRAPIRPQRASPIVAGVGLAFLVLAVAAMAIRPTGVGAQSQDAGPQVTPSNRSLPAAHPVLPEDLKAAEPADYRISPNDLLGITISDLNGPNTESLKQARVTESGIISVPYINEPVHAAGRTEIELEQAIIKAYSDAKLIALARVSVTVIEARGRCFSITGAVQSPNTYPILDSSFRLLNAIAIAHGTSPEAHIDGIRILRPTTAKQPARIIDIPVAQALVGEDDGNIFIRPGDTIVINGSAVPPPPQHIVRLIVGADSLRLSGRITTWEELDRTFAALPDRSSTILEVAPDSKTLTVGRFFEAQSRAADLAAKLGFESFRPIAATAMLDQYARLLASSVFIRGRVTRPGTYSLPPEGLSAKGLIKLAGDEPNSSMLVEIRQRRSAKVTRITIKDLFHPAANRSDPDPSLDDGDEVIVGVSGQPNSE